MSRANDIVAFSQTVNLLPWAARGSGGAHLSCCEIPAYALTFAPLLALRIAPFCYGAAALFVVPILAIWPAMRRPSYSVALVWGILSLWLLWLSSWVSGQSIESIGRRCYWGRQPRRDCYTPISCDVVMRILDNDIKLMMRYRRPSSSSANVPRRRAPPARHGRLGFGRARAGWNVTLFAGPSGAGRRWRRLVASELRLDLCGSISGASSANTSARPRKTSYLAAAQTGNAILFSTRPTRCSGLE